MFSLEGIFKNGVFRQITSTFPIFLERTYPSSRVFSNTNFASNEITGPVCPDAAQEEPPRFFPLFGKKLYLLAQGHFDRDGEGTFGETKTGLSSVTLF